MKDLCGMSKSHTNIRRYERHLRVLLSMWSLHRCVTTIAASLGLLLDCLLTVTSVDSGRSKAWAVLDMAVQGGKTPATSELSRARRTDTVSSDKRCYDDNDNSDNQAHWRQPPSLRPNWGAKGLHFGAVQGFEDLVSIQCF